MHHISRNAPCPCGSGRRYKHCHGATNLPAQPAGDTSSFVGDEFTHALNLHKTGKLVEAELIYANLLKAQPANPLVLHYLGVINYQRKALDEAKRYITQKSATCATAAPDFMQVPGHFLSSKLATSE